VRHHGWTFLLLLPLAGTMMAVPAPPPSVPRVEIRRGPGVEATIAVVQGTLLAAAPARDWADRQGVALLVAAGKGEKGWRSLQLLEPGKATLEPLAESMPETADSLVSMDLGEGAPALVVGSPGVLDALIFPNRRPGKLRRLMVEPGLDLRAFFPGLASPRPADLPGIPVARAGLLQLLAAAPGASGSLRAVVSAPLPVRAGREGNGIRLASPPVHLLPGAAGSPSLFAVGPEVQGKRRIHTLLLSAAGAAAVDAWSLLPEDAEVAESRYTRWEGRPALLVSTFDKAGINAKRRLRLFLLAADRTGGGALPVLDLATDCPFWSRLDASLVDVDGDGRQDLVLIHRLGLRGKKIRCEVRRGIGGSGGDRFEAEPRVSEIDAESSEWAYGDWNGDGAPDLAVLDGERLLLYPGAGKTGRLAERPAWALPVGPVHPGAGSAVAVEVGGSGEGSRVSAQAGAGYGFFEIADAAGLGAPQVVLAGPDHQGHSVLVLARRVP